MNILKDLCNENNWRVLLVHAIEETKDSVHPVLEMGLGGQSQYVHELCRDENRRLITVEEDFSNVMEHRSKFESKRHEIWCTSWSAAPLEASLWSVALLKHAPGDRRWVDALRLKDRCEIIVLHNTEPEADYGYHYSQIWDQFKYRVDVKANGAWATAVSNSRNLSKWRGQRCGPYFISGPDEDLTHNEAAERIRRFFAGDYAAMGGELSGNIGKLI